MTTWEKHIMPKSEIYLDLSPWTPLKNRIFRFLWMASVISNIGTCMNDVGAAWLMTSLTNNPLLVALIQAASSLPICLLALPAGALADILDRRRSLIVLQTLLMIVAATLTTITFLKLITPNLLLLLTFCLGIGGALSTPAWQATVPELVPPNALAGAINLNSAGMNISRAIGPALAGIIITAGGTVAVFAINAVSFLGIIITLFHWKRKRKESTLPAERLFGAIRTGVRYVYATPVLHNMIILSFTFIFFASSIWALLPLIARDELHYGATGYGTLFALLGTGAVIGAIYLPRMSANFSNDQLIKMGYFAFAVSCCMLALLKTFYFAGIAMLLSGLGWIITLATLMTTAQQAVPSWVKGRALSIYFMAVFSGMAIGSTAWGMLTRHSSIPTALLVAASGLLAGIALSRLFTVIIEEIDHTPYRKIPTPVGTEVPRATQGPVMVTIEYTIDPEQEPHFIRIMRDIRRMRLREGAFFWKLFKDIENITHYTECFMSESWIDHLRYHERISVSDNKLLERAKAFQVGKKNPRASHLVACDLSKKR
jgi:MFS family permease